MAAREPFPALQELEKERSFIARTLARLTPPEGAFDANGTWTHVYRDIGTLDLKFRQGDLTIGHHPDRKLHIEHSRNCPDGFRSWTVAELQCHGDNWTTPTEWKVETKVSKRKHDAAYLKSGTTMRAIVEKQSLNITSMSTPTFLEKHPAPLPRQAASQITHYLPESYTCKWCLLDAVGRMATTGTKEATFTLLDEYDAPCPRQRLVLRDRVPATTRSGTTEVTVYQHTGIASMPGEFYVDREGRVLAYIAGMQLLILAEANGKQTWSQHS